MLCPKCGQEYEGSQCPRCDGPVVLVNNSDYLKRKKAYEERLKNQGSEELKKEEEKKEFDLMEVVDGLFKEDNIFSSLKRKFKKLIKRAKKSNKSSNKDSNASIRDYDNKNQAEEKEEGLARHVTIRKARRFKYNIRRIIFLLVALVCLILIIVGIYKLVTRKNYELFFSYNDKIYSVTDLDSSYICDESNAVFAVDNKTFYEATDLELSGIVNQKLASDEGDYLAFVQYLEEDAKYQITVATSKGNIELANNNRSKELVALLDSGILIYSETEELNDEGGMGSKSLNIVFFDGLDYQTINISEDVSKYYVYTASNLVIGYDNEGNLFEYNYKTKKNTNLEGNVTNLLVMSSENNYYYSYSSDLVNESDKANSFIYAIGYVYYLYNIKSGESVVIDKSSDSNMEFIYDETNDYMYALNTNTVYSAKFDGSSTPEYTELDNIKTARDVVYNYSTKELFFVDGDSNLVRVKKGEEKELAANVLDGSFRLVENDSKGICYIVDNSIYYAKSSSAKAVKVYTGNELTTNIGMVKYKNKLYFYASSKLLCSCSTKGSSLSEIGNIAKFWLGTKLK